MTGLREPGRFMGDSLKDMLYTVLLPNLTVNTRFPQSLDSPPVRSRTMPASLPVAPGRSQFIPIYHVGEEYVKGLAYNELKRAIGISSRDRFVVVSQKTMCKVCSGLDL